MPPAVILIGLLGRSRVGKDTVADALVAALATFGAHAEIWRLSQPLKDAVRSLYGFCENQIEGSEKELADPRYGITPRVAINRLCEHMMANHGVTFFTRRLYEVLDSVVGTDSIAAAESAVAADDAVRGVIIPDVRYAHDISEIRRRGGLVVKIHRDVAAAGYALHPWENHIDFMEADVTLENDRTLADLRAAVVSEVLPRALALLPTPQPPQPPATA